ncbi:MAG: YebC/PmpR family DNA-binding transcriptional regulator [Candidatus Magasanikbacteria bacterium CG11_big_fil_rev_8_21_14_0_20_39_34]|uniref:Probable transcriptional regulatory protein COV59_00055 n=1 Tax=Candidatus Magasanikbacteria bacterium CG11_big_fil_rev_8_21_14_0_20_39_34 TaxID=1974653 RepID=A0A2H0N6J6_9BACT|nr:MAG: YebC/PmpR family DNA-binding transcriptional regulator [Candidatus Magasanikbacteria bacterium CG11_big_fil_rev_8_21_14_0_20_39_34]
MSGHSKWSKIQHKKGKNDKARSAIFTKLLNAVTIAAQQGGGDPEMNFVLRLAIQKAKTENVPKDNIDRAVKRGSGEAGDGVVFQEGLYEGFGPGGVAVLVETLTDNPNRTISEVKHAFTKNGGSFGSSGSVSWQFEHLGRIYFDLEQAKKIAEKKEDFELACIEAGADDILEDEEGVEIRCAKEKLQKVSEVVQSFGIEPEDSALVWIAKEPVEVDAETSTKVETFYEALEENADVKEIYTNLK